MQDDQWREVLTECVIYGLLFKAVAKDAASLDLVELKMSYRPILEAISTWAERKHHDYSRQFRGLGGKIHVQETQGFQYFVLVTFRGLQHESVYNKEVLRAQCQVRLNSFLQSLS